MSVDDSDIQRQLSGHATRNAELLERILDAGHSLDQRRSVEHHFWASGQHNAAMLARELYELGYLILVIAPAGNSETWNVEAGITRTFSETGSAAITEQLVMLASRFQAVYDGWGASI